MKEIRLATTTSAQDSGLLAQLLSRFESESGYKVQVQAVGSGQAMELARRGKADILLVHDPEAEQRLMDEGFGTDRRILMHNDFILVGPIDDPAKVKGMHSVIEAFKKIVETKSRFISRNDVSGTDKREKEIWQKANTDPHATDYQETKSGMAETLAVASGKKGYVLTDRATFLSQKHELKLEVMVEGDDLLLNIYHVIQVNPTKSPGVNAEGAKALADFLNGPNAQEIIGNFMKDRFGCSLFVPDAGKTMQEITQGNWKQVFAS
ncbi:substrate-binding domain-containing protein [Desulfoscipio gibsoniae]|uniref:ABC-type tungstate transport system, permease component n=1 Tax=Desulfoscipio gibsoniae DSM 7213 TaxID=767817 RepID=R4KNM1_9FIRM|nr:substrate-binding domain-containing protein [Desulfoscipio gibsoniae]AGL03162.1 ABC-type tungstate transport system, permease component [Desulfoscipio gibsoniae DSM 7213]